MRVAGGVKNTLSAVPVTQLLTGLELKGDLLPWQDLSPLADVVRVIGARPVHVSDGVGTAAVRQRHPEAEQGTPDVFRHFLPQTPAVNSYALR